MALYSKNGSIPKPETDGTEGWVEVSEAPVASEGQEVVWWCPPGWVVRPTKPVKEGFDYSWSQSEEQWVEHEVVIADTTEPLDITISATANSGLDFASANQTITLNLGTAMPTDSGSATFI